MVASGGSPASAIVNGLLATLLTLLLTPAVSAGNCCRRLGFVAEPVRNGKILIAPLWQITDEKIIGCYLSGI